MTAQESDDGDSQECTGATDSERELEQAVGEFIRENIDLEYRQTIDKAWLNVSDALEAGDNPEPAYWALLDKVDELADLLAVDLSRAGHINDRGAPYLLRGHAHSVAHKAARAARNGDESALERAYTDFKRVGESLGKVRVGVLGPLEEGATQPYEGVAGSPGRVEFRGPDTLTVLEPDGLETAVLIGMVSDGEPSLTLTTKGDGTEAEMGVDLTPEQCRDVATMLFRMAGDAVGSGKVDTGGEEYDCPYCTEAFPTRNEKADHLTDDLQWTDAKVPRRTTRTSRS